jgi:hypothetical protein
MKQGLYGNQLFFYFLFLSFLVIQEGAHRRLGLARNTATHTNTALLSILSADVFKTALYGSAIHLTLDTKTCQTSADKARCQARRQLLRWRRESGITQSTWNYWRNPRPVSTRHKKKSSGLNRKNIMSIKCLLCASTSLPILYLFTYSLENNRPHNTNT